MPSGRGFLTGDDYFLPLASAEVIQIDLTKGQIVSRAKSRLGEVPGNLICHQGQMISQAADNVEVFYQLDGAAAARSLKSSKDRRTIPRRSPGWAKSSSTRVICSKRSICFAVRST